MGWKKLADGQIVWVDEPDAPQYSIREGKIVDLNTYQPSGASGPLISDIAPIDTSKVPTKSIGELQTVQGPDTLWTIKGGRVVPQEEANRMPTFQADTSITKQSLNKDMQKQVSGKLPVQEPVKDYGEFIPAALDKRQGPGIFDPEVLPKETIDRGSVTAKVAASKALKGVGAIPIPAAAKAKMPRLSGETPDYEDVGWKSYKNTMEQTRYNDLQPDLSAVDQFLVDKPLAKALFQAAAQMAPKGTWQNAIGTAGAALMEGAEKRRQLSVENKLKQKQLEQADVKLEQEAFKQYIEGLSLMDESDFRRGSFDAMMGRLEVLLEDKYHFEKFKGRIAESLTGLKGQIEFMLKQTDRDTAEAKFILEQGAVQSAALINRISRRLTGDDLQQAKDILTALSNGDANTGQRIQAFIDQHGTPQEKSELADNTRVFGMTYIGSGGDVVKANDVTKKFVIQPKPSEFLNPIYRKTDDSGWDLKKIGKALIERGYSVEEAKKLIASWEKSFTTAKAKK